MLKTVGYRNPPPPCLYICTFFLSAPATRNLVLSWKDIKWALPGAGGNSQPKIEVLHGVSGVVRSSQMMMIVGKQGHLAHTYLELYKCIHA